MRIALLAVAAGLGLSGCIIVADGDGHRHRSHHRADLRGALRLREPDTLYAATVEPDGVRVRAASNGCTTEESFDADVDRIDGAWPARYRLSLRRTSPDRCAEPAPDGVELFFSRASLGLADGAVIRLVNRVER